MTVEGHAVVLTIDGRQVQVSAAATIYEAACAAGIHIPTFCHHPKLKPVGACRMCLVEIEGQRGLQTSCTTTVREGMVVRVHTSPTAVNARRANLEFLLTNHPLDCPVCDKGGECLLQDQALLDGPGQSRYVEEKRHKNKRYPLSEFLILDQERCVLCWRCVRFLDEWADDHQLDLFGRGASTRIDTFPGHPLDSKWQGNTIDVCPVGALTSRVFRFEARVWELTNTPSLCPLCSVGCNISLGVKNNAVRRITPRENAAVNDVWICDKGRFGHAFVDDPQRLQTPLVRRDGELQPASWDEALELVAKRFTQVLRDPELGPQAIGGLGSTHVTNEANYLFQRFMRTVVGSNNIDHLGRIPAAEAPLASLPELECSDLIVLLGFDPSVSAPLVELWIKKAVLRRGARVVIANPRRIELARYGGPWLGCRPGSEVALLNGLAHGILHMRQVKGSQSSQAPDPKVAVPSGMGKPGSSRVANLEEFRTWLKPYGPEHVSLLTGVPADVMQEAAGLLAQSARPILLYGPDWLPNGPHTGQSTALQKAQLDALANLALLLGETRVGFVPDDSNGLGALDMGVVPDLYPGGQVVQDAQNRSRFASFWGTKPAPAEGLDFQGMMAAVREGRMKALWVMGSDPAHDSEGAGDALGLVPFLVVQDLFLTDTGSMAEVVLPSASFAEIEGSFTNMCGRVQAIHAAKRPPGQAKPDWWIIAELARRMVTQQSAPPKPKAMSVSKQHAPGTGTGLGDTAGGAALHKLHKAWTLTGPDDVLDEISRALPGYRGLDYAKMGEQGWQRPDAPAASRRVFVRVEAWSPQENGRADRTPASQDSDYPLTLVYNRTLYDRGTWLRRSQQVQRLVPAATIAVHPEDAKRLDLATGEAVSVVSAQGRLGFTVQISDEIVPGVVMAVADLSEAPLSLLFPGGARTARVRLVK